MARNIFPDPVDFVGPKGNILFQYDGSSPHFAALIRECMERYFQADELVESGLSSLGFYMEILEKHFLIRNWQMMC